jgi:hypothetical protein
VANFVSIGSGQFTFSPAGASVYQLGTFGTARKELKALELKRKAARPSDAHHEAVVSADRWPDHVPTMRGPDGPSKGPKPG